MDPEIPKYNDKQESGRKDVCHILAKEIDLGLSGAEGKIWHGHPVWFLDGNPIVGYSQQKPGIRLMFWRRAEFEEPALNVMGHRFRDASVFFHDASDIDKTDLRRWLKKAEGLQWD